MFSRIPALSTSLSTAASVAALATLASLAACSSTSTMAPAMFSQSALPAAVQVPAGHKVVLETVGKGQITYECREKKDAAGMHEWVFVGPVATLMDRSGATVGRYFGPPATWAAQDGSALTGAQVAVAPAAAGSIPLQLVKGNPATGAGAMQGVTYIQRVATVGGVAPATPCNAQALSRREVVNYQADYIFWKAI